MNENHRARVEIALYDAALLREGIVALTDERKANLDARMFRTFYPGMRFECRSKINVRPYIETHDERVLQCYEGLLTFYERR